MKVCLIRPPYVTPMGSIFSLGKYGNTQGPSIGLALIAGQIERAGHQVQVIDCLGEGLKSFRKVSKYNLVINGLSIPEAVSRIAPDAEVVGITMMFSMEWFVYENLANQIKNRFPGIPVIAGGEHITAEYGNIFKTCQAIDYCVLGEGDETVVELLDTLKQKESIDQVNGIAFVRDKKVVVTPPRSRIQNIDDLALPLWEKFPIDQYLDAGCSQSVNNRRSIPIMASRGCPFACTFCTNKDMWGTRLYLRSPDKIIEEIQLYKRRYNIEHLDFCDPVGVINREWIIELFTRLRDAKLGISWLHGAGTRSEMLDEEVLRLFKDSGAQKIHYAPESGSKTAIERMKKSVNIPKITESLKRATRLGLVVRIHIMYGMPGQTLKEVLETMLFTFKLAWYGVDDVTVFLFASHPGSQDYRNLIKSGRLPMDKIITEGKYADFLATQFYGNVAGPKSWSENISSRMLSAVQLSTYLGHYLIYSIRRPWRWIYAIKRALIQKKPVRGIENNLYRILSGWKRVPFRKLEEAS